MKWYSSRENARRAPFQPQVEKLEDRTVPSTIGDVHVLATVPNPGYPEGIAVQGDRVYVAGPARFGTAGNNTPSPVFAFNDKTGELLRTYQIQGEDLNQEHANSCIAFDGDGRLYVLNTQKGIVRLNVETGAQHIYSPPLPDLPAFSPALPPGTPSSPTTTDRPPLPNDLAFDRAGNLFVTDSFQATIWRVPAGGGQARIWFQDSRLDSPFIGPNGIRINPEGTKVYVGDTIDFTGQGYIFTLPLEAHPSAADLHVFHQYSMGELPDGFAFGQGHDGHQGKLYVTLAAPFNSGISILGPDGTEVARLTNPTDPTFPYDSPANIAFDGRGSLLVTNHAFATMNPAHMTVLEVYVNDKAGRLFKPEFEEDSEGEAVTRAFSDLEWSAHRKTHAAGDPFAWDWTA